MPQLCSRLQALADRYEIASVADATVDRNVRFYVHLGLVDRPHGYQLGEPRFGPRHLAQVMAIRALKERGMPLAVIGRCVKGLNPSELESLVQACQQGKSRRRTVSWENSFPEPPSQLIAEDRGTFLDWLQLYQAPRLFTEVGILPQPSEN